MEKLKIADREFTSRLFIGTGKFSSNKIMEEAVLASGSELVTVALKRVDISDSNDDMLRHLRHPGNILVACHAGSPPVFKALKIFHCCAG